MYGDDYKMKHIEVEDERQKMSEYLDKYSLFHVVCKEHQDDLTPVEITLLFIGYSTGGV